MVPSIAEVVRQFKQEWTNQLEPQAIEDACREAGLTWRDTLLNPVMTVQLFFLQVLNGNTACTHLRHLAGVSAEQATLNRLLGHVENFETQHTQFVEENQQEFDDAGFEIGQIVSVTINRDPLIDRSAQVTTRLSEISVSLDGKPATDTEEAEKGLVHDQQLRRERIGRNLSCF